ncbi:hypothetical protein HQ545_06330 [Candidatus Woesearchaeota archaeon]|nr:hypothetical protein [Candidatus Woesearchaeota archaeon]
MSVCKGKQLELWTAKLFDDLGYITTKSDGNFAEIFYAESRGGRYVPPMFQVDVEYRKNRFSPLVVCECKNYQDRSNISLYGVILELLRKTHLSGASKGQLIITDYVPSKERKEERYSGVIEIYDLQKLEELDMKRRRRKMPLLHRLRTHLSVVEQIRQVQYKPEEHHRRLYKSMRSR